MRREFKRFGATVRRRPWASGGVLLLAVLLLGASLVLTRTPRLDRNWVEHLAVTPVVAMRADGFTVAPATDWSYDATGPTNKRSIAFSARYNDLRNVWFVLEPQPGGDYAAHTLVLFEFGDDRIIGLTVEARRELTSNCTNELAKSAGLGWHPSWILTGHSPERLFDLRLIPGASPEAAKTKARMDDQLRGWNGASSIEFDRLLLRELHTRGLAA